MTLPIYYRGYDQGIGFLTPDIATDYWRRFTSAQKGPPYVPAVYDFIRSRIQVSGRGPIDNTFTPPIDARTFVNLQYDTSMEISTQNQAYERLRGKLMADASLGTDFAESRQSMGMITKTMTTLGKSFLQVKRLDFLGAAQTLRMKFVPKGTSLRKSASNNWLEYYFGWVPLVKGIYDAVEVVNNPLKSYQPTRGVGFEAYEADHIYFQDAYARAVATRYKEYRTGQGATIRAITNSDYHTLEQFGLINPLSVAWELVPFSFVVDWFSNVGDVLRSYSDFAGMQLENRYIFWNFKIHAFNGKFYWYNQAVPDPLGRVPLGFSGIGYFNQRNTYNVGPVLKLDKLRLPSKERALTATALLVQLFSKR